MWAGGTRLREDPNRPGRHDEHTGSGGVQDLEIFLQDRFRHGRNQERGSRVRSTSQILHIPVKRRKGTHSLPELRESRTRREGNDKGRGEQTRGQVRICRQSDIIVFTHFLYNNYLSTFIVMKKPTVCIVSYGTKNGKTFR